MKLKAMIITFLILFSGCQYVGNSQINDVYPDWLYIRSDDPSYQLRDIKTSGNCADYAVAAYCELLRRGYDRSRLQSLHCEINGKGHRAIVLDDHKVYSVGETWVLEKADLDWAWSE